MRIFTICTHHQILSGDQLENNEMGGACSTCGEEERYVQGFGGKQDHLEDLGVDGKIILRWIFRKWDAKAWPGLTWLRIGTRGGHLYTR